ncbi:MULTISPECIES: hypothetical protein [Halobacterium]|uniref:hypothetical protein n=1 Tax=Halobacterium TaxID=2239 RepID=UPI00073E65C5|nr:MULTISPECIES: hypothetical protein [Halobacterium]MCG1003221.1 hypothetical protein [Halobacterium noricense]
MASSLPAEWAEVQNPDYITEKYRATNPTLFVREDHDVGVHVLPVSTSSPHDAERYRAAAIRGNRDEFDSEHPIETVDDREAAFERALEFATHYETAYADLGDEDAAMEAAVEAVA